MNFGRNNCRYYRPALLVLLALGGSNMSNGQTLDGIGGMIKSHSDVVLAATTSGNIQRISRSMGDEVKRGDIILSIQCDAQKAAYARAQAELHKARINAHKQREQNRDGIVSNNELDAAEAELDIARAGTLQQKTGVAQCTITATRSGTLVRMPVKKGQWVQQGEPVAHIVDTSALYIALNAPESAWGTLAPGTSIKAKVESTGAQITATISNRSHYITENGAFLVEAELVNARDAIPGMRVVLQGE